MSKRFLAAAGKSIFSVPLAKLPNFDDILQDLCPEMAYNILRKEACPMNETPRTILFDDDLHLEFCRFTGMEQPFPNHFHDYYVLGLIEAGTRRLFCRNRDYIVGPESLLLFHPGDSHGCTQSGSEPLDYRSVHIPQEIMRTLMEEISGEPQLPSFSENIIRDDTAAGYFRRLHGLAMSGSREFEKEETFLFLLALLLEQYGHPSPSHERGSSGEINSICTFIDENYGEHITLDQLCRCGGFSKSGLLRAFTREKGVTPYRYLQAVRIGRAKTLLEQGASPAEAALQTGFADQSHFTRFFTQFIGLPPAAYGRIYREGKL